MITIAAETTKTGSEPRRSRKSRRSRNCLRGFSCPSSSSCPSWLIVAKRAGRLCALGGFLLLLSGAAAGQEPAALRISLEEAQGRAVAASHRLAEARARAATADAAVAVREAADRPLVGIGAGYTRTNHVMEFVVPSPTGVPRVLYPDVPDNYRTRLDLQWPIYSGGDRKSTRLNSSHRLTSRMPSSA